MICLKLGSWLASQKADKNVQLHCRSPHGERGLKFGELAGAGGRSGRSPHGERGLKYHSGLCDRHCKSKSLSSWRAWIEIRLNVFCNAWERCRSPHGERGLKFDDIRRLRAVNRSLSSWRAWIEMPPSIAILSAIVSRSPHGERGLK